MCVYVPFSSQFLNSTSATNSLSFPQTCDWLYQSIYQTFTDVFALAKFWQESASTPSNTKPLEMCNHNIV